MAGLRKLRRARKFGYNRNRKRLQKTLEANHKKNIKVLDPILKANWDRSKALKENMAEMGLAVDANEISKIPSGAQEMINKRLQHENSESLEVAPSTSETSEASKVVKELESEVKKVQKKQTFRFPDEDVRWMVAMLDKHGEDFKAMSQDPKNMFQLTPKQIRQKIVKFMNIPEQFTSYAKDRGLLDLAESMQSQ